MSYYSSTAHINRLRIIIAVILSLVAGLAVGAYYIGKDLYRQGYDAGFDEGAERGSAYVKSHELRACEAELSEFVDPHD